MNIKILQGIEGAKKARGIAVIIDVFRAFTVEAYLMNNGAKKIIPVADKELAYDYKNNNSEIILIGERGGKILPGFDYGNSPSQIEKLDFHNKVIVHTTSSGTQGLVNAADADIILTGSLVNAKAIANFILKNNYQEISLVCMGSNGNKETDEDNLCAYYIKSLLENKDISITKDINKLKETSGKKFFDPTLQDIFPLKDFFLSTDINKFNFVLKLEEDNNHLKYIKRIDL
ncbi:MAG: 2-phosphosulfolactate phosphatase [Bacilli bacterium]|nr:2-phosphosulfolactate phosphatase [Bacilli bacterium]